MAVTVEYPVDEVLLNNLIDAGWDRLRLYVADAPEGPYTNSGATPDPATLAEAKTDETFVFTFEYGGGSPSQYGKVIPFDDDTSQEGDLSLSRPFPFGGGMSLREIRQALLTESRRGKIGLADSGATTTSIPTKSNEFRRFPDDYFNDWLLYDADQEDWRIITDWDNGTATFTVSPAFASAPSEDNRLEAISMWSPEEIRDAINWGIYSAYPQIFRDVVNTSVRSVKDTFQYDIPSDILNLSSVEIEGLFNLSGTDSRSTRGHRWTDVPFRPLRDGTRRWFEIEQRYEEDRHFRLIGQGLLSQLYNEDDLAEVEQPRASIIIYYALHRLYMGLLNDASVSDINRYQQLASLYLQRADAFIVSHGDARPPQYIWGPEARGNRKSASIRGTGRRGYYS